MKHTTFGWKQLTSLVVGGAICHPVIMVGHKLCQAYGLPSALLAIGIGNGILFALAMIMLSMSMKNRKVTAENAQDAFGRQGSKYFAAILLTAKTAWFAIQLNVMSLSLHALLESFTGLSLPTGMINLGLGVLIVGVALCGIQALSLLSSLSMPVLIGTMAYAVYYAGQTAHPIVDFPLTIEGASITIATALIAVIDMPTYFRLVRSRRDGLIAVIIIYLLALPAIEGVGVYLAYANPAVTLMETLYLENSALWNIWIALFLLLAGWTTNNTNLYSATVCSGVIASGMTDKKRTLLVGCMATMLALMGILEHFTVFLQLMGIMVGSMGAVIIVRYLLGCCAVLRTTSIINAVHLGAFASGVLVGLLSLAKLISITQMPLVDAFCMAALVTLQGNICLMPVINTKEIEAI